MRKKILAISYLFPNCQQPHHGIFVLNRLAAMSKFAEITVINPIPDSPIHGKVNKLKHYKSVPYKEELSGLTVYHPKFFSIPGHLKSIESLTYYCAALSVVKEIGQDFDLIDLHWTFPDLPTGAWLAKKLQVPFNLTLRGMEAFHQQDFGSRKHIVKHFLAKANNIISLSQEMADTADQLANTARRTSVIRNGVDTDKFYYIEQKKSQNQLGLSANDKIILGVGAIIYRKGFDLVIKALAKLIQEPELASTKFYIVGSQGAEGDYRSELTAMIAQLGLQQHVIFAGKAKNDKLLNWYNAADVFCLSSRGEGSPNVLTEALACGTPAVACEVGSVKDIMTSEPNLGLTVPADNIEALYRALKSSLLAQDTDRHLVAKQFGKYTWDWCAKKVMSILQ